MISALFTGRIYTMRELDHSCIGRAAKSILGLTLGSFGNIIEMIVDILPYWFWLYHSLIRKKMINETQLLFLRSELWQMNRFFLL